MNDNSNGNDLTGGYGQAREIETTPENRAMGEVYRLVEADYSIESLRIFMENTALIGSEFESELNLKADLAVLTGNAINAQHPDDRKGAIVELRNVLKEYFDKPSIVVEDASDDFETGFPKSVLKAHGQSGAILSAGEVSILSAQGGAGKSTLACALAVQFASRGAQKPEHLGCGLFDGYGGGVFYVTKEDTTKTLRTRMQLYRKHIDPELPENVHKRVKMAYIDAPIFGVPQGAHQGVRPEKLPMWDTVWEQIYNLPEAPKLIIFDTISKIYAASQIEAGGVNDFIDSLKKAAGKIGAGVLLIGHSNKEARKSPDPFDPGQVSGTGAWYDAVRGIMTLTYTDLGLILAVPKANYGKPNLWLELNILRAHSEGMPLAYEGKGEWQEKGEYYDRVKQAQQDEKKRESNGDLDAETKTALEF